MEVQISLLPGPETQYRFKRKEFEKMSEEAKKTAMGLVTSGNAVFQQNSRYVYLTVKGDLLNAGKENDNAGHTSISEE